MIIGLTGTMGAGKGTVASYLKKKGFEYHSFSDVLREEAKKTNLDPSRINLQSLGNKLREKYKNVGYLSTQLLQKIKTKKSVLDGVRNVAEISTLRQHKDFVLIGIDAPPKMRFDRMIKRQRKGDPNTFEEFKKLDDYENNGESPGQNISTCLENVDHLIINEGSIVELKLKIEKILRHLHSK